MIEIARYSDYNIQTINYFATLIEDEINARDIKNLSNGKIDFIQVTKEHPLVTMMASKLGEGRNADPLRANLLPAIGITPGSAENQDFGMGLSQSDEIIDDDAIAELKALYNLSTNAEIQAEGLITKDQITAITSKYRKMGDSGVMKRHITQWGRNEEVNISCWAETPDIDCLMDNLINSVLAGVRAKFPGDESPIRNAKYRTTRGLTNFNFGRVLFGSEYSLTFLNIYNNYRVYVEDYITGFEFDPTFTTPGQSS
jgi:hypothetical protein